MLLPVPTPGELLDLTERFDDIGRPFFICMGATMVWLGAIEVLLLGEDILSPHRAGQTLVLALLIIGASFPSQRTARILGGLILVLLLVTFATFRAGLS